MSRPRADYPMGAGIEKKLGATQGFWTKDAVAIRFVKHQPGLSFGPWLSAGLPSPVSPRRWARAIPTLGQADLVRLLSALLIVG